MTAAAPRVAREDEGLSVQVRLGKYKPGLLRREVFVVRLRQQGPDSSEKGQLTCILTSQSQTSRPLSRPHKEQLLKARKESSLDLRTEEPRHLHLPLGLRALWKDIHTLF